MKTSEAFFLMTILNIRIMMIKIVTAVYWAVYTIYQALY